MLLFYYLFSSVFMFGVLHDRLLDGVGQFVIIIWCLALGWISMPIFIGHWLVSMMKKN